MEIRILHIVRHVMPNGRLVSARLDDDGVIIFEYRDRHIHPDLVHAWSGLGAAIGYSGLLERVEREPVRPPLVQAWAESGNLGIPMTPRIHLLDGMPLAFEIRVMEEMIDPALLREMNEETLPHVCDFLIPTAPAPPT
jgi:hypothetical protein